MAMAIIIRLKCFSEINCKCHFRLPSYQFLQKILSEWKNIAGFHPLSRCVILKLTITITKKRNRFIRLEIKKPINHSHPRKSFSFVRVFFLEFGSLIVRCIYPPSIDTIFTLSDVNNYKYHHTILWTTFIDQTGLPIFLSSIFISCSPEIYRMYQ